MWRRTFFEGVISVVIVSWYSRTVICFVSRRIRRVGYREVVSRAMLDDEMEKVRVEGVERDLYLAVRLRKCISVLIHVTERVRQTRPPVPASHQL